MILNFQPFFLEFRHPFGVSSNTRTGTATVFAKLSEQSLTGYGEACLPAYLGETTEGTTWFLEQAAPVLRKYSYPFSLPELLNEIDRISSGYNAAKAALDIALHDLIGKLENKTCYQVLGLTKSDPMSTCITIGIDREDVLEQKIKEAADFSILKIKAGTNDDKHLVNTIRKFTGKPLYLDVNQGWQDKEHALDMALWLKEQGVILLEQPLPVSKMSETAWLTERSPLPIVADESVKRLSDLEGLEGVFSGINIKLMKCTGLHEAMKMVIYASGHGLKILLGCMAESSCATSAMSQVMGLADYIDLDAPNLIKNDPFTGISYQSGKVVLNDLPGIGAKPLYDLFNGK